MKRHGIKTGIVFLLAVATLLYSGASYGSTAENSIQAAEENVCTNTTDNQQALSLADQCKKLNCHIFSYIITVVN